MRMHPRRRSAFNFAFREMSKDWNRNHRQRNGGNSGCLILVMLPILSIVSIFIVKQML